MSNQFQPLRVLVVDDDVDAAQSLCLLLQAMGCRAAATHDAPDGLALAAEFEPELAIIDLEMPGMKGPEMVQHLRLQDASTVAMVVCLTGRHIPENQRSKGKAGFDAFITKPIAPDTLVGILNQTNELARRSPSRT
jgi:CheY-like chemotaxis protein